MKAKSVIKGIVPWADARLTLATRLRRKLAEDAVRAHIASADPCIERTRALELLQQWYWQSCAAGDGSGLGERESEAQSQSWHSEANSRSAASTAGESENRNGCSCSGASAAEHDEHEELIERDERFLMWLHGAQGAAKIGAELKKLKRTAAAATFHEMARSEEGREGLLMSLREMVRKNSSLKAQLASVIDS